MIAVSAGSIVVTEIGIDFVSIDIAAAVSAVDDGWQIGIAAAERQSRRRRHGVVAVDAAAVDAGR